MFAHALVRAASHNRSLRTATFAAFIIMLSHGKALKCSLCISPIELRRDFSFFLFLAYSGSGMRSAVFKKKAKKKDTEHERT